MIAPTGSPLGAISYERESRIPVFFRFSNNRCHQQDSNHHPQSSPSRRAGASRSVRPRVCFSRRTGIGIGFLGKRIHHRGSQNLTASQALLVLASLLAGLRLPVHNPIGGVFFSCYFSLIQSPIVGIYVHSIPLFSAFVNRHFHISFPYILFVGKSYKNRFIPRNALFMEPKFGKF